MRKHGSVWIPFGSCIVFFIYAVCAFGQSTDGIAVDVSGRVGIGTSSPPSLLSVGTQSYSEGMGEENPSPALQFDNRYDNSGATTANKIILYDWTYWRGGIGVSNNDIDFFSGANFRFYTSHTQASEGNESLTILQNGNVGMGATNPASKLQVQGNIFVTDGANRYVKLYDTNCSGEGLYITSGLLPSDMPCPPGSNGGPLYLDGGKGSVSSGKVFIATQNSGSVGIGTTAPAQKLDVNGNVTADDFITKSSYYSGDALKVLTGLKSKAPALQGEWAKIEHSSGREIAVIHEYQVPIWETKMIKRCWEEPVTIGKSSNMTPDSNEVCEDMEEKSIVGYETKSFEGISLDKAIAVLIRANQQLLERIEALEAKVNK